MAATVEIISKEEAMRYADDELGRGGSAMRRGWEMFASGRRIPVRQREISQRAGWIAASRCSCIDGWITAEVAQRRENEAGSKRRRKQTGSE